MKKELEEKSKVRKAKNVENIPRNMTDKLDYEMGNAYGSWRRQTISKSGWDRKRILYYDIMNRIAWSERRFEEGGFVQQSLQVPAKAKWFRIVFQP